MNHHSISSDIPPPLGFAVVSIALVGSLLVAGCGRDTKARVRNPVAPRAPAIAWAADTTGTTMNLLALWGSLSSDIFVGGYGGIILHGDGKSWTPMTSGTNESIYSLWGDSGADVFAVGHLATILHYNGTEWAPMTVGPMMGNFWGVWGSPGSDVFAVGDAGTILRYRGGG